MANFLSPTDCYFCKSDKNIKALKFPCDCMIYAHPDCYNTYVYHAYNMNMQGVYCVKCKRDAHIQIIIPQDDDSNMKLTMHRNNDTRTLSKTGCIVIVITVIYNLSITAIITFIAWSSMQYIFGVII